ncbi:Fic family protein [Advenella mimigardefordensis]|uniref:Putative membrane protein, Fic/Doc family n=1 Tax=Advenella mimigardefordensis (strain DSM 17166 / LMG 22922 / DPN7) TaxID=1247726 RepID=W0PF99_ADVMD|nr:Fic family protein [Advenella mimigardefordensis]AHG65356.1 putative membrane protein, Fic/Doc family [Advenella mimigardefordensis DPN7]
MSDLPNDPIGAAWLEQRYEVRPVSRLPVQSQIGNRRATQIVDGDRLETYQESMRPSDEPVAHLQFHLRHEVPQLEFLSRLFTRTGPEFIQAWVDAEPTGQYARRAAFLYEWLTEDALQVPERLGGNYVDAIDDTKLVAASSDHAVKVPRWRIKDNLPGTRYFCPMVVKTDAFNRAAALDVLQLFQNLQAEFGEDLLRRAAVWMTLRESKATFTIEGEADRGNRIERFADVMARRTGQGDCPLTDETLAQLQGEILGKRTSLSHLGLRHSPVFVGETVHYQDIVHYVAPPHEDVGAMLHGLQVFLERTQGQSPVMRSAVAAFGFVYIHPLADGNGRVHRFLINDILRRDGVVPEPVILPVSAVITDDAGERRSYDRVLDEVSKPLMHAVREFITFKSTQTTYSDGVVSNFEFGGFEQACPVWRYPDLGPHVIFLSNIVKRTLTEQMREQSRYLRSHGRARQAIKEIVEMPDQQADRVLRSIEQNRGELSNVLAKEIPVLREADVWKQITEAVSQAFQEDPPVDRHILERYHPARPAGETA